MKKVLFLILFLITLISVYSQAKPKVVITIVVEQMRWEYLNRFSNNYSKTGFQKLLKEGYSCPNTTVNYLPTSSSPGIASIFTGTVPSMHGITADEWYDPNTKKNVYSVEDTFVAAVGSSDKFLAASPINLQVTTVGDEMRLFSNRKSKVLSVSLKDRAAVLAGGHSATGVFWYDKNSGKFISSTFYFDKLPEWVNEFNSLSSVNKYYSSNWSLLLPEDNYNNKNSKDDHYRATPFGKDQEHLPYDLSRFVNNDYSKILSTPFGNNLVFDFAKKLILNESLGKDEYTDLLSIDLSSTDYIGHAFPPNTIELEDTYIRLDKELSWFIDFLDKNIGKSNYLLVLTSPHGVANSAEYLKDSKVPSGRLSISQNIKETEIKLKEKFGDYNWIKTNVNNTLYLNDSTFIELRIDKLLVINEIQKIIEAIPGVQKVINLNDVTNNLLEGSVREKIINGIYSKIAGDLLILLKPNFYDFSARGTTHGSLYSYDIHIPLIWYGCGIKSQKDYSDIKITDIAPTISSILGIQEPNASTGKVIQKLLININENQ